MNGLVHGLGTLAVALAVTAGASWAGDAAGEDPGARLRALLEEYDRAGAGNTTPLEMAILELRDAGAVDALAGFLGHPEFGATILWAMVATGKPGVEARVLPAFLAFDAPTKTQAAIALGGLRTEEVRRALREAVAAARTDAAAAHLVPLFEAALLRARDEATTKAHRADLGSKDADRVAAALLRAAEARETAFLADAARFAGDERPVANPVVSDWSVESVETNPDGGVTHRFDRPHRATLGAVALEAANRMVKSTTPDFIAWWYDLEKGPRFGFDAEAKGRIEAWVAAETSARKAKAPPSSEAVAALVRHLRQAGRGESTLAVTGASFEKGRWLLSYALDGAPATATYEKGVLVGEVPTAAR